MALKYAKNTFMAGPLFSFSVTCKIAPYIKSYLLTYLQEQQIASIQ